MQIITQENLATHLIAEILDPLRKEYKSLMLSGMLSLPDDTFDVWLWQHTDKLGSQVYAVLGDHLGGEIE